MRVGVIDTGVFVAGIYWRNEPHQVLRAVLTEAVFDEYIRATWRSRERERLMPEPTPCLETFQTTATWVSPVTLHERVCHDHKDDKFIEAALGAECDLIVARDQDLTALEKPFGISILTLRAFLATLTRAERRRLAYQCRCSKKSHLNRIQKLALVSS